MISTTQAAGVLLAARELISGEGCWTQDAFAMARTETAVPVDLMHPSASSFDICGAVIWTMKTTYPDTAPVELRHEVYTALLRALPSQFQRDSRDFSLAQLLRFNDDPDRNQDDVILLFTTAIKQANRNGEKQIAA